MSNIYGKFTPLPSDKRSQMAKDAAKTRNALHPNKNSLEVAVMHYQSLSPEQRLAVDRARNSGIGVFSILMGLAFLSIPLMFFVVFFG